MAAALVGPLSASFAADAVPRLTGELTYKTFPRLTSFLFKSSKHPVALDVTIPIDNVETNGHLATFVLDGQFEIAYLNSGATSKLYADSGFDLVDDKYYTLKGVFKVDPPTADDFNFMLEALDEQPAVFRNIPLNIAVY